MPKIYYWEISDILWKKIWRNALDLRSKKVQDIFEETIIVVLNVYCSFRLSFIYKSVSQISFNLFCSEGKSLLSEFLKEWGWFHRHNDQFSQISCLKTETRFCRWISNYYNNINIFLSLENRCTFLLAKKKTPKSILNN